MSGALLAFFFKNFIRSLTVMASPYIATAVNTIAAEAEVTFDVRFADNASRDAVLSDIEALCRQGFLEGVRAEMVPPGASSAMAETEASRALMALVDGAAALPA